MYIDPKFYINIGESFCILKDVMYAKTGIKFVDESLYGFIRNQEMHGGQSLEVLANSTKVGWSFRNILNCRTALGAMTLKYITHFFFISNTFFQLSLTVT